MYATLGGYSVLDAILKTDPKDFMKLLWRPCQNFASWIGSIKYIDSLDNLLRVIDATKFGDIAVEESGDSPALVTLQEILSLFRNNTIKSIRIVSSIGTEMIEISPDSHLMDALRMMFQMRIRRLFLTGERKRAVSRFVSSRHIIRFLFSPERLEIVKRNPELWTDAKLSEIEISNAKNISDEHVINQAAREIGDRVDDCLVCERSKKVVTRWDIVMKPWKAKNYSFE